MPPLLHTAALTPQVVPLPDGTANTLLIMVCLSTAASLLVCALFWRMISRLDGVIGETGRIAAQSAATERARSDVEAFDSRHPSLGHGAFPAGVIADVHHDDVEDRNARLTERARQQQAADIPLRPLPLPRR